MSGGAGEGAPGRILSRILSRVVPRVVPQVVPRVVAQLTLLETVARDEHAEIAARFSLAGSQLPGVAASHAGAHFDFSVGGGDVTWDLAFENDAAIADFCARVRSAEGRGACDVLAALATDLGTLGRRVEAVEFAVPESIAEGIGSPDLVGVKRTLWMRVLPEAPSELVMRFEQETPLLARAIPAIRNWRWSRIRTASPNPMETRWTHLWEQEFDSVDGLQVDYMSSPAHWGFIDRYFDPEMPDQIIDLWIAHLACPMTAPVLARSVGH